MSETSSAWQGGVRQHDIETPEQVTLHFPLAGLGSRFLALLIDSLIQFAAYFVIAVVLVLVFSAGMKAGLGERISQTAAKWFIAGVIFVQFLLYWGYFALFEAFRNGQTPGKRAMKVRVIKNSGRQITFFEALARNLLRVVDVLPGLYLVGAVSILVTQTNKRLGDMVADTLVVHERVDELSAPLTGYAMPARTYGMAGASAGALSALPADRIARLTGDDLHLIDSYLARAISLPMEVRAQLASRVLDTVCAAMDVPVPTEAPPERTLEGIAYQLRSQGRV